MVKIFFTTFFMAELIIAVSVIIKICEYDRRVKNWNCLILKNKEQLSVSIINFSLFLEDFSANILKIKNIIKQKRRMYLINFLKTFVTYFGIFALRGKYKKTILVYQLIKEIYEGILEA